MSTIKGTWCFGAEADATAVQASKVTAQGLQVAAVLGAFLTVFLWVAAPNLVAAMRGEGPVALHMRRLH